MVPFSTPPRYNVRRSPKMGSRTENQSIRLGQKADFALILFRSPLGARNGCTWRMSASLYQYSSPRSSLGSSREEVVGIFPGGVCYFPTSFQKQEKQCRTFSTTSLLSRGHIGPVTPYAAGRWQASPSFFRASDETHCIHLVALAENVDKRPRLQYPNYLHACCGHL